MFEQRIKQWFVGKNPEKIWLSPLNEASSIDEIKHDLKDFCRELVSRNVVDLLSHVASAHNDFFEIPRSVAIFTLLMRSIRIETFVSNMDSMDIMSLRKVGIWTLQGFKEVRLRQLEFS